MLHLVVVAGVLICVSGLTEGCGKRPVGARVVGGVNAQPFSWPWQVSLRVNGRHICGGSLIKPDWVITAAHCVARNPNPRSYTVVVGAHTRTGTTPVQQTIGLKNLYPHKQFNTRNLRNDIALLQLDRPARLGEKVNVVCLPIKGSRVAPGTKCFITGWGRVVGGGSAANILQQAELPVVAHSKCSQRNSALVPVDETSMLCAGTGVENKAGGCQGDSGGPFVCEEGGKWVLRGAVSWGHSMCRTKYYTVFARVSSFIDWIEDKVKSGGSGGSAGCKDKSRFCRFAQRYCRWSRVTRQRCPKTCRVCGADGSSCRDSSVRCPSYVKYCSFHPVVKAKCKKTCQLC